jgi:fermentation-respiration switch protein FrsA (DUF1100 family)
MNKKSAPPTPSHKKIVVLISCLILLTLATYSGISVYAAYVFTQPNINPLEKPATVISKNYEDVSFTTSDNVVLKGWIFPGVSNKAVIMVPGMWQNRLNADYGTVDIAKELLSSGYTVMLFDLRGNGESQKVRIGYGFVENRDVVAAVKVLTDRHFLAARIGIIGDSLGAITLLHSAPELFDIGAIIADSPASDMKQLIADHMVTDKHLPRFLHPGIFFMAEHLFGIPIIDSMPFSSVTATPERTYLYLHGEKDTYIPLDNSKKLLFESNMYSKLITFKNADHIHTYKTDPPLYRETVFSFLEQQLGK